MVHGPSCDCSLVRMLSCLWQADDVCAEAGTGRKRRRTSCASVSYSDVTDAVFLRMLDGTETPAAVARGRPGAAKPPGKRQKNSGGGTSSAKQRPPLVPPAEPKVRPHADCKTFS